MPDLPGSSYEKDKQMFDTILGINSIKYKNHLEKGGLPIILDILKKTMLSFTKYGF